MISGTTRTSGPYTGNGSQTLFPITFDFFSDNSLVRVKEKVIADDNDHGDTVLVNPTHYTIVGTNVVAVAAPAATKKWLIELIMPQTQAYHYISGGIFPQADHETNLDRLTRTLQQAIADDSRSPRVSPFSGLTNLKFPEPVEGMIPGGNADEDGWENVISVGDITAAAGYAAAAAASASSAAVSSSDASDAQTNAETAQAAAEAAQAAAEAAAAIAIGVASTPFVDTTVAGALDGVNTTFTLTHAPVAGTCFLIQSNLVLVESIHFTRVGAVCDLSAGVLPAGAPDADQPIYGKYSY